MKKKNFKNKLNFSKKTISNLSKVKGGMPIDETKTCPKTLCYCDETKNTCYDTCGAICPGTTTNYPR